ncbi:MAG TPA: enoyl-CoA hydratase/isomerase family protein [Thermoanaerobaculia bacterium]|jgi:methylglutaconyl-CoA hydratase|nr:enoyl-CoA hydratase/isomerase family protein [Thermoanaerobaculia bacterium]
MAYNTLNVEHSDDVLTVSLNRPEVHNAFNDELIAEAIDLFSNIDPDVVRVVVLQGTGKNFCAGADLNWMSRMVSYTREENVRDSALLAKMYALINECPLPVVGRIHGAAIGGGVGLVAVCDVAIALTNSQFGLSEVKLGILPAVISPYVISKIGETHARALFLTGERFDADRALRIGLVHRAVESEAELDAAIYETVTQLKTSGPEAVRECKKLIAHVASHDLADAIPYTIDAIVTRRVSEEGQEGMKAFLNKGLATWVTSKN